MPRTSTLVRQAAIASLKTWSDGHVYAETLVDQSAKRYKLSHSDRGLLNAILLGTLRNLSLLDHWILQLRDGKLDASTRDTLRIGLCQLLIIECSEHAAVNETVEAARRPVRGLVNGVLRSALRRKDELLGLVETLPPATRYSHPQWLVDRWTSHFGASATEELLTWNNQPASTYARINPLKDGGKLALDSSDKAIALADTTGFYEISGSIPRDWIADGLIYIQDPATRHCVDFLAPQAGETLLDACAAPGGKAALTAAAMQNSGVIVCTDSNAKRLPRLEENLKNLGITIAETTCHDWTQPAPIDLHQRFDGILLDVPCSNTGVLRRRVDARWRLTAQDISEVVNIQTAILENALPCLKPGGRLVYSTCSIDPEENTEFVKNILEKHPQLQLVKGLQILPQKHDTDGAYTALLTLN